MTAPVLNSGASKGVNAGNVTTVAVTLPPASFSDGDTIYIAIASDAPSQTFTGPSGFTALYSNVDIPATSPTATFALFYKNNIVKASETFDGTNYTFSVIVGTSERQAWQCWSVTGDGGIDVQGTNSTGNSATATLPALTTSVNDCLVIGVVATDAISTPHGTATGYTKLDEISGTSAASESVHYQTATTSGTLASQTVSITSEQWLGISFAIKPVITGRTGTASISLSAATVTAVGAVAVKGTLASTLDALTVGSAGVVAIKGTAAIPLDALTSTGSGLVPRTGSASVTLGALTLNASGLSSASNTGAAAITFGALTLSAVGIVPITGAGTIVFDNLIVSSNGVVPVKGTLAKILDTLTLSATAVGGSLFGTATITLDPLGLNALGTGPAIVSVPTIRNYSKGFDTGNTTTTMVTLPPFVNGDTIYITVVSDAGSQALTTPSGFTALYSDVGVLTSTATMATFYRRNALHSDFSFDGTNYTVIVTVATSERQSWIAFAIYNDGGVEVQAANFPGNGPEANVNGLTTLSPNDLVIAIVATDGMTIPHTDSRGSTQYVKLDESAGVSAGSISVWQGNKATAGAVAPMYINLNVTDQWLGVAFAIKPSLSANATITLDALTLSAIGNVAMAGQANSTLGILTLSAAGTVPRTGAASITLGALTVNAGGTGLSTIGGTAAITLGVATLVATGGPTATPIVGTATISLGALTVTGHGFPTVDLSPATIGAHTSGTDTGNTLATTVVLPTFVDGDTVYIAIVSDAASQVFTAPVPLFSSTPFAALYSNVVIPTSSPTATFALFYLANAHRSDFAFDGTNYNVSIAVSSIERQSWIAFVVRGDGGSGEQGINESGSNTTAIIPAVTPINNNSLLIGIVATDGTSIPHTGATNYDQLEEIAGSSAGSLSVWTHTLGHATAHGPDSVTIGSEQWLGISFAIAPTNQARAAITLDALTIAAGGVLPIVGVADITLGSLIFETAGLVPRTGSSSITLGELSLVSYPGRIGMLAKTLGALTVSSTGNVRSGRVGNASIQLGILALSATGELQAARPEVAIQAQFPNDSSQMGRLFGVIVENAAGFKVGGGPIVTGTKWNYRQKLSAAGEWSLEVPLAEPRLQTATLKRRVNCYVRRSGRQVWLGGGIIESRNYGLSGGNVPGMTLSGPDLLRELNGVTVKFEISTATTDGGIGRGVTLKRTPRIFDSIFSAVPNWKYTIPADLPEITARFVHESVLNALVSTCEKIGAFFWMEPYTVAPRKIIIVTQPVASNIVATNMADPLSVERNQNVCLISDIERQESSWDAYNRLIVYGAGDGQARLTLASATMWPDGLTSITQTYAMTDVYDRPHVFLLDKTTNTITDLLAVADYGTTEKAVSFKEIAPITPDTADMIAAADTLVVAAVNQLILSSQPSNTYRLSVAALRAVVHPGMRIRVQARKMRDDVIYLSVDEYLIIQEVEYQVDENGEKVTGLIVATTWRPDKTGATILSEQIQKLTALEAHPQIGANENTISYREDVDDDYGASFPYWLSRGTQLVNSITLRYRLEQLRSSVKTIGGTASGTVDVPSHAHNLSPHSHAVPNHAHDTSFQPGSGGAAVSIFSGGGSPDFGSLVANGIGHTIRISTTPDTGAVTSDGNSTITVSGGGTAGISVDISNAITAEYGVFVDPEVAYTVDDLTWSVNSNDVTESPISLGDNWYEVDITNYLIDVATGRPIMYSNSVSVGVKPTNHAGRKVRVTTQIELRTTIQTLAVV